MVCHCPGQPNTLTDVPDARVSETLMLEPLLAILSTACGVLALLMASIGLYGVTSYSVSLRRIPAPLGVMWSLRIDVSGSASRPSAPVRGALPRPAASRGRAQLVPVRYDTSKTPRTTKRLPMERRKGSYVAPQEPGQTR